MTTTARRATKKRASKKRATKKAARKRAPAKKAEAKKKKPAGPAAKPLPGASAATPPNGEGRIEYVPLSQVKPWTRNPKLHDLHALMASMRRFGFVAPVVLDEDRGRLVAGHGRLEAVDEMRVSGEPPPARVRVDDETGEWLVPVVRGIAFSSEREAEAYLLADNRLVERGGWDERELGLLLKDIAAGADDIDEALAGIGYDMGEALEKIGALAPPEPPPPPTPPAGSGQEFGEGAADGLAMVSCPHCGGEFPAP